MEGIVRPFGRYVDDETVLRRNAFQDGFRAAERAVPKSKE
jgi:hypothetical protein